jgi:uncharacterized protein (TIGR02145 family)
MRDFGIDAGLAAVVITMSLSGGPRPQRGSTPVDTISRRMADGKEWTTANLNVNASPSYCYDDAEQNCRRYGRLYTWESAQRVCQSFGDGWRLPTDDEWRQMAKRYGGVSDDSADKGRAAFTALLSGGTSGFNAVLGGNRSEGQGARLEAHGFTGWHQTAIRAAPPITTSAKTAELSIVSLTAKSRWLFPCGVSGSDCSIRLKRP